MHNTLVSLVVVISHLCEYLTKLLFCKDCLIRTFLTTTMCVLNLTQFLNNLLSFVKDNLRDRLNAIFLFQITIDCVQHPHDIIRCETLILSVATDGRRSKTLIRCIEHPICAECNVRPVESHCTSDIEPTIIYQPTELREQINHLDNPLFLIGNGEFKISVW